MPKKIKNKKKNIKKAVTVGAPSAMGGAQARTVFPMQWGYGATMRIRNYEQMTSVVANNGFFAGGFVLNPGLPTQFTWLSGIASSYQKFKWNYLRFIFVPSCPTTTAGSVFLYLSYDYVDSAPTNLAQVDVSADSSTGPAWLGTPIDGELAFRPGLEVSISNHVNADVNRFTQKWYYVRDSNNANLSTGGALGGVIPAGLTFAGGSVPDTAARPGIIYYGSDVNSTATLGRMYVCYDVEFSDPIAPALNT